MKRLIYIILAISTVFAACDDDESYEYGSYEYSPIKSVSCYPIFWPLPVSDGTVVSVAPINNVYNFLKIMPDGTTKSTPLTFTWSSSNNSIPTPTPGGNFPEGVDAGESNNTATPANPVQNFNVDITSGSKLTKNSNDEYYFDYYSDDDFGRRFFAVVKFDKDCNILFQIDSTVNTMGGGRMGGDAATVTKLPKVGTPLNNGGYAMILQAPSMGMFQSTDYSLTLRIITDEGKYAEEYTLDFSEAIKIVDITSVNNNIAIYYALSDDSYYYNVYTMDGQLIGTFPINSDCVIYNYLTYGNNVFLSGYNYTTQKFYVEQVDENGQSENVKEFDASAILTSITEFDGYRCFSGFFYPETDQSNIDPGHILDLIDSYDGIIMLAKDGTFEEPIIADYNNGVIIWATFKNTDGTYTVFLSQITPLSTLASQLGDKIYIYRTNDLKKLEVN